MFRSEQLGRFTGHSGRLRGPDTRFTEIEGDLSQFGTCVRAHRFKSGAGNPQYLQRHLAQIPRLNVNLAEQCQRVPFWQ